MKAKSRQHKKVKKPIKISSIKYTNKQNNKLGKRGKLRPNRDRKSKAKILHQIAAPTNKHNHRYNAELSDDDVEFYSASANRGFAKSSLSDGTTQASSKFQRNKKRKNEAASYEHMPRDTFKGGQVNKKMKFMLPIKSCGKLIPQMREIDKKGEDNSENDDDGEHSQYTATEDSKAMSQDLQDIQDILPDPNKPMSYEDLMEQRTCKMTQRKETISKIAHMIIADPYENVEKLKHLRTYLYETDPDVFITVKKLAMVTLCEVFKDIIPDYKIRLLTEDEEKNMMKKATQVIVDFEKELVTNYRQYLEFLDKTSKGKMNMRHKKNTETIQQIDNPDVIQGVSYLAVKCLCTMLTTHPTFNYCNNIVAVLVPKMIETDDEICDAICAAIKLIFRNDKKGIISLEIIKLMGDTLKRKSFNAHPKVLNTCLSLNIKEIDMSTVAERAAEKRKKKLVADKMSRKEKSINKKKAILDNELSETRASEDKEKTLKMHTDIIKNLFVSYFRILKNAPHSVLMPAVLEGLAKFAHLINVEFFDDLFAVFNKLIQSEKMEYRELLHCVQTAFTILTGQGSVLNVDHIQFYRHFYSNLLQVHAGKTSADLPIVIGCLDIMLSQRKRQVSIQRVLAFLKRITTMSLHHLPHGSIALLAIARNYIKTFPRCELLFDEETQGSGVYLPELDDPEYCNAQNTALWELPLMIRHYNKDVSTVARHVSLQAPMTGQWSLPTSVTLKKPIDLYQIYNQSDQVFDDRIPEKIPKSKQKSGRPNYKDWLQKDLKDECDKILDNSAECTKDTVMFR